MEKKIKVGRNRKKIVFFSVVFVFIVCLAIGIYLSQSSHEKGSENLGMNYKKVLVIGLDGMDPKVTSQLIAEGKLPNFKKLSEEGVFSSLSTSYPPHSPVAWTSIATGVNPGKHNIFDFIRRNVGSYIPELSLAKSKSGVSGTNYEPYVSSDSFYKITSDNGIATDVIRWPVSFPPERVDGNLLAGLGVPDVKGLLSGYTYYTVKDIKVDNKNIKVSVSGEVIGTELYGPKVAKSGKLADSKIPMQITILPKEKSAELTVNDKKYVISEGKWSDWIVSEFKTGIFARVSSTFKVYLINSSPDEFEMYVTSMQIDPENPVVDISYPRDYSSELVDEIGRYYTLGMPEETDGYVDGKIDSKAFLAQISDIESERDKMFWKEFEDFKKADSDKPELFAFVYDSSDRVQHVFWENKLLDGSYNGNIKISKAIEDYWIQKDKFLGKVMDEIPENTLLLVLSDHGFTSFEEGVSVNTWLVRNGFMSKSIDAENEDALFQGVDWSRTKAYSLGFNSIYLNIIGREPKGIVDLKDKEKVENEIIKGLESLKDEKGNKVVNKVYKASDIYSGPELVNAPDLIIGFNPGFRMAWQTAVGGFSKDILMENTKLWTGDHLIDPRFVPGVLFSNQKLNVANASQLDIAPTILNSFGISIPADMDGKSLLR